MASEVRERTPCSETADAAAVLVWEEDSTLVRFVVEETGDAAAAAVRPLKSGLFGRCFGTALEFEAVVSAAAAAAVKWLALPDD